MSIEDSTLVVVRALERIGVRYYITGSLASTLHGEPRTTNDADIVAELQLGHFRRLASELSGRFVLDEDEYRHAVRTGRSFNLIDEVELAKIDVFCPRDEYALAALGRTQRLPLETNDPFSEANVSAPEDTVLSKLRWYRLGNEVSDRQWNDVRGVIAAKRPQLDLDYLRLWGARLGVADLLEKVLAQLD